MEEKIAERKGIITIRIFFETESDEKGHKTRIEFSTNIHDTNVKKALELHDRIRELLKSDKDLKEIEYEEY